MLGVILDGFMAASAAVFDLILGWTFLAGPSAAVAGVAALSLAMLVFVRPLTVNQDLMRRTAEDKRRLARLIREAKSRRDRIGVARHRAVVARVNMKRFRYEMATLGVIIVPLAMLATWGFMRLEWLPPEGGEAVTLRAYVPPSNVGRLMHAAPEAPSRAETGGVEAESWVALVRPGDYAGQRCGVAEWRIRCGADLSAGPRVLAVRLRGETYRHGLEVGGWRCAPAEEFHPPDVVTAIEMERFRPFGVVPGIPWIGFSPWVVAYVAVVVPLYFALKAAFRIW